MNWRKSFTIIVPIVCAAVAAAAGLALQDRTASTVPALRFTTAEAAPETFTPIAKVLRDPRCMNCHPAGDRPRQGNDRHFHLQNVHRGIDDMGFVNMRCNTCHRDENNEYSGVPGAPSWHLAPLSMGWEGLNDAQLCTALKDKKKNGNRDVAALVEHMANDKLVLWGWAPGGQRKPVATPHDQFVKELEAWNAAGAPCPAG